MPVAPITFVRIPVWCGMDINSAVPESAKKARAWVWLLTAWDSGNDAGPREVARTIGYPAGYTSRLTAEVAAWAIAANVEVPDRFRAGGALAIV